MGISGLLPLLKSIQKPTHLSELAGKTIAVDAYVWLHKGAYSCAVELVTEKATTKYVDYAMHRVRLLRHYKITPYVVFDGGPLPAKKKTEVQRQRKRDENLEIARTLTKQGNHSLAREHYVKCVDITPQIAFQFIKALRAEQVPYLVAPYEADAQLYFLESSGIVDGILTEDSDLLVFGTKLLLLKLDMPTAMCTAIHANTLASNSPADLPLHGWGIKELRECAMLSGCDYLEGVRGVGLKTASKYLRKWGTVEKTLRALRMDGKVVDRDWEERMRKAEVGFLHQRVWDPRKKEIVYLTEPDWTTWNEEREEFVGGYIDAGLAGGLAQGDIDPITLESMVDIMPEFQPSSLPRPLAFKDVNRHDANDNIKTLPAKASLFQYFSKLPKTSGLRVEPNLPVLSQPRMIQVGRASGKRTLIEQYDHKTTTTKRHKKENGSALKSPGQRSKFFAPPVSRSPSIRSRVLATFDDDKENLEELEGCDEEDGHDHDPPQVQEADTVEQEEGYITPPFLSPDRPEVTSGLEQEVAPEFSSPLQCRTQRQQHEAADHLFTPQKCGELAIAMDEDCASDDASQWGSSDGRITSPPSAAARRTMPPSRTVSLFKLEDGLVQNSTASGKHLNQEATALDLQDTLTVDLRDIFVDSQESSDVGIRAPSLITLREQKVSKSAMPQSDEIFDEDEDMDGKAGMMLKDRHKVVAEGWGKRFSHSRRRLKCESSARQNGISPSEKDRDKSEIPSRLRRHETMPTSFHTGIPRRTSMHMSFGTLKTHKSRRSEPPALAMSTWTPVRVASGSTTPSTIGALENEDDILSSPGSQKAVVDDPGTDSQRHSNRIAKLQAFRFR